MGYSEKSIEFDYKGFPLIPSHKTLYIRYKQAVQAEK
jgi:hypothetical protein